MVGDAKAGEAYFGREVRVVPLGDRRSARASRRGFDDPRLLQQTWLHARQRGGPRRPAARRRCRRRRVTVTAARPARRSKAARRIDDFVVSLDRRRTATHRSFRRDGDTPKVEVHDPLQPHKELLRAYTDTDIHDVTAYLVTLK